MANLEIKVENDKTTNLVFQALGSPNGAPLGLKGSVSIVAFDPELESSQLKKKVENVIMWVSALFARVSVRNLAPWAPLILQLCCRKKHVFLGGAPGIFEFRFLRI